MIEMRENRAKRKLERGEVVTMLMGEHNSPDMIDYLGQHGFDSIFIEERIFLFFRSTILSSDFKPSIKMFLLIWATNPISLFTFNISFFSVLVFKNNIFFFLISTKNIEFKNCTHRVPSPRNDLSFHIHVGFELLIDKFI